MHPNHKRPFEVKISIRRARAGDLEPPNPTWIALGPLPKSSELRPILASGCVLARRGRVIVEVHKGVLPPSAQVELEQLARAGNFDGAERQRKRWLAQLEPLA